MIQKIHKNAKLSVADIDEIKRIVWKELGTPDDYRQVFGTEDLGLLIRRVVGLDKACVDKVFSEFMTQNLNVDQMKFVGLVIDYVSQNGFVEGLDVFKEKDPFVSLDKTLFEIFPKADVLQNILGVALSFKNNVSIPVAS